MAKFKTQIDVANYRVADAQKMVNEIENERGKYVRAFQENCVHVYGKESYTRSLTDNSDYRKCSICGEFNPKFYNDGYCY